MSTPMRALRLAGLLLLLSAAACGDDDDDHDHRTEEDTKDAGPKPSKDAGVNDAGVNDAGVNDSGAPSESSALPRPGTLPRPPKGGLPDDLRPPR